MATIQEVAKIAGVSVATVSRVLNNSSAVVDETREKVQKAINELNYNPNMMGRNLRRNATKIVMVLLPSISNPFYSKVVNGITSVAKKNGFTVMICNTSADENVELEYLDFLKYKLADGAILMSQELGGESLLELAKGIPIVQCSEYSEVKGVPYVSIDNFSAAYDAVKHLIDLGHTRIGLISSRVNYLSAVQRQSGYIRALQDAGIDFDPTLLKVGNYGFKSGMLCASQFIAMQNRPTAVFAISDLMAIGAIKAFKKNGLNVPEDIAVVGFDNLNFSTIYDPELTTISQPTFRMGCKAMDLLLSRINGKSEEPQNIIMDYELIVRESTVKQPECSKK